MTTSPKVLDALQRDLALEHGAIIQYLIHGTLLRDSAMTDPVRKIAREEMWHFEWLAEAIRDRGGEPALDRADVFLSASPSGNLTEDVSTEGSALSHYAATLELVGDQDADLTQLIERIVADERHHRVTFERLARKVAADGDETYAAHPLMGPEDLGVVGPTVGLEYASLLQYLFNKYGCGDCGAGEGYFELAVDEMRHMSWAAAYVPGVTEPRAPDVPADRVRFIHSTGEAHRAAELLEGAAAEFYSAKISQANDAGLAEDLNRAAEQHAYHRYRLGRMG